MNLSLLDKFIRVMRQSLRRHPLLKKPSASLQGQ